MQHFLTEPQAAKFADHGDVVNVDQRFAGESGEAFKAVDQPGRFTADEGQHAEGMRAAGEFFGQALQQFGRDRMTAAHGIFGVVVEHDADGFGVHRVAVAGLKYEYFCGIHFHPR